MKNGLRQFTGAILLVIFLSACGTSAPTSAPVDNIPTEVVVLPTSVPNDPCANTYFPSVNKSVYAYTSSGSPSGTFTFRNILTKHPDGFTITTKYRQLAIPQDWSCKPEGLIAAGPGFTDAASVLAFEQFTDLTASNITGISMPANLAPGAEWTYALDLQGTEIVQPNTPAGTMTGRISITFKAGNMESVTVPAGTFDAIAIEVHSVSEFKVLSASGQTKKIKLDTTYTVWYAPNVGWVKSNGTGTLNGLEYFETIVLNSYKAPKQ